MTKDDFLLAIPESIIHNTWGYGELEILEDTESQKAVCYRHLDKTASFGMYEPSWVDLYKKFFVFLIERGYMVKTNSLF